MTDELCPPQALGGHQAQERAGAQSQVYAIPEQTLLQRPKQLVLHCFPAWLFKRTEVTSVIKNYFEIFTINVKKRTPRSQEMDKGRGPRCHVPESAKGGIPTLFLTSTSTAPHQVPPFIFHGQEG